MFVIALSNTIVWILLGAAEAGEITRLDGGAVRPPAEPTLRCVRFLASLLLQATGAEVLSDIVTAVLLNLQVQHGLVIADGSSVVARWLAPQIAPYA